ncbi:DNA translocase FtsK [Pararhodobacter sp.]|uniref:DNA translocase FtsK n=1 Tax=Pararhodobacter sp. TaxID=2127056 RepID=UPI002FDC9E18
MASYPSPQRQPLLDQRLQQALSQRGKELLGIGLIGAGALMALILGSYSPDDPSWMATSDGPVNNALGRAGAAIAAPVTIIMGKAGWGIVLALLIWGLRLVTHRGEENILGRSVFVPIAIALSAVWLATLVPGAGWALDFGLGGMFGDTVLGALLTALPLTSTGGLNMLTVVSFWVMVALWLYVLGTSGPELRRFGRFLVTGLILSYMGLITVLGGGARGMGGLARRAQDRMQDQRDARQMQRAAQMAAGAQMPAASAHSGWQPEPQYAAPQDPSSSRGARVVRAEPALQHPIPTHLPGHMPGQAPVMRAPVAPQPAATASMFHHQPQQHQPHRQAPAPAAESWEAAPRPGLLARVLGLRGSDDAAQTDAARHQTDPSLPPGDERIKSRISDVIRARQRQVPTLRVDQRAHVHHPVQHPAQAQGVPGFAQPHLQAPLQAHQPPAPPVVPSHQAAGILRPEPALSAAFSRPVPEVARPVPPAMPVAMPAAIPSATAAPQSAYPLTSQPATKVNQADLYPDLDDDDDSAVFDDPYAAAPQPTRSTPVLNRRVVQTGQRRSAPPSRQAQAEAQPNLKFEDTRVAYELPPLSLLSDPSKIERYTLSDDALEENARMLESVLDDYGVRGEIVSVRPGPVVTMYELEPAPGLKASRVIGLADDIARSMSALSARVSTVPGRSVIGIELPNATREKVVLREILSARDFGDSQMRLPLALGKDIGGESVVANLAKMPHLLIAGTTGSGKSVAINTMILSLLYKLTPAECRLIMIDPKMLELSVYDGIPHLLSPVVTDPKKAVVALKWVVGEMEERYRKMSKMGVRNIEGFNGRVREAQARGEMFKRTVQTGFDDETGDPVFETEEFAPELLPFIVVIVDEMADLMMVAGKEIEACIQRLAQMARASGIHLIMATQRPSVDVITGTIKANFPTRISFQVTSKIDSRTILGEQGAEQLLGMGDMLYMAGGAKITRIHGPFVSDEEVEEVVNHLKSFGPAEYMHGVLEGQDAEREADIDAVLGLGDSGGEDALYDQAVAIVAKDRKCSTSYIQRKLGIGYNKAARLVEQMESEGVVSPANHVGKREILVPESH